MNAVRASPNAPRVEQRQQLDAAVSAAHGDHRVDVRASPARRDQRARAGCGVPATIAAALEHAIVEHRLEAEPPQLGDAGVELVARSNGLAGATSAIAAARREPAGTSTRPARVRGVTATPPSRVGDGLMLRAADDVERAAGAGARRQQPRLDALLPRERVVDPLLRKHAGLGGANHRLERRRPARRSSSCTAAPRRSRRAMRRTAASRQRPSSR